MTAERIRAARPADGVDLIDEDDRRGDFARFGEELAHPAGADADDHFDELRCAGAEERHIGFACRRAGEQRFARAWRPGEQHALRRARSDPAVLRRVSQKVDHFVNLGLDLVDASDVGERDTHRLRVNRFAWATSKKTAAHRALLAPEHPEIEPEKQQHRPDGEQQIRQDAAFLHERLRADRRFACGQFGKQIIGRECWSLRRELVVRAVRLVRQRCGFFERALDGVAPCKYFLDVPVRHFGLEFGVRDGLWLAHPVLIGEHCEQNQISGRPQHPTGPARTRLRGLPAGHAFRAPGSRRRLV